MRWYARIFRKQHRAQSNANITHPLASDLQDCLFLNFVFLFGVVFFLIFCTSEVSSVNNGGFRIGDTVDFT